MSLFALSARGRTRLSSSRDSEVRNSLLGNDSDFRPSQSRDLIPHHVGFIMDGNGRWAQQRNLPRSDGHSQGATTLRAIVRAASERGISQLTCYALSTENYVRRSDEEIGFFTG